MPVYRIKSIYSISGLPDDAIASLLRGQSLSNRILTWSIRYSRSVAVFGPQMTHRSALTHTYADLAISTAANSVRTSILISLTVKSYETDLFKCTCCERMIKHIVFKCNVKKTIEYLQHIN